MLTLTLFWVMSAAARAADCPEPMHLDDFEASARAGERAFAAMDLPGLTRARIAALEAIPCLADRVNPPVAADFHRMMAMAAFTQGDEQQVRAEFHAARRLDPGHAIPAAVAPAGHPLTVLYDSAVDDPLRSRPLEAVIPPEGGSAAVDGADNGLRAVGLSAIVQTFDAEGALQQTIFLMPGDATPAFGPLPLEAAQRKRRRITLGVGAGTAAVAALGLYAGGAITSSQFHDLNAPVDDPELRALRVRNNALLTGAAGASALALGLSGALVILW
jgi:hypothetical protein